jgi:hypothetical protein
LFSFSLGRDDLISIRKLMVLTVIVALICWYGVKVLFAVIGSYGS